jgi:KAP family P-loop domain
MSWDVKVGVTGNTLQFCRSYNDKAAWQSCVKDHFVSASSISRGIFVMNIDPKGSQTQQQQRQQQQMQSVGSSVQAAEPVYFDTEEVSRQAFGAAINPKSVSMQAVAKRAIYFAKIDTSRSEIVIDRHAVVQAILDYGQESKGNASAWFAEFVFSRTARTANLMTPRHSRAEISASIAKGFSVRPSHTVGGPVTERAKLIASLTIKRDVYDMRHFIMALLHQIDMKWWDFGINLSDAGVVALRQEIAERTLSNPEPGERKTAWQALVITPPSEMAKKAGAPPVSKRPSKTPPPPSKKQTESLPIHTDDPATVDLLGRKGFATVLADRIIEARNRVQAEAKSATDDDDNRAFIVHMHGPWGSGKSTVLNFIRARLENENPPWLVVEFNAWRSQRLAPPWWSLILALQKAALKRADIGFVEKRWLALRWHWMRARADYVPMLKGIVLLAAAILIASVLIASPDPVQTATTAKQSVESKAGAGALLATTKDLLGGVAAVGTAIAGIMAFGRSLLFGGGNAAKAYEGLQADPYTPMMTLFCRLVHAIDRPIIIFIDDLDRCERAYVCELLENVQTMLRAAPITYLVAADRKWITTSFEKRYADFSNLGTDPGRPLGYQFLDKMFQVSATLPTVRGKMHDQYWNGLLRPASSSAAPLQTEAEISTQAQAAVADARTLEDLQAAAKAESNPVVQQAIRAEGARKMASDEVRAETEHRLERFSTLIEPNPRAMKRLANAVGMNLARAQIEGRDDVPFEAVARWTIIELRWPLLADWLSENPARLSARAGASAATKADANDQTMHQLLKMHNVRAIIGGAREKGRLSPQTLAGLIS